MTQPKVALVFTTYIKTDAFHGMLLPALGLERLGAAVEDIADVELYDIRFEPRLFSKLKRFQPDIVAVNVKTTMYAKHSYEVGNRIREVLPKATIVTGGLHATACPEESFEFADCVVRGEGEDPFRRIVAGKDFADIPNIVWKEDGNLRFNEMAVPNLDMDGLKPPARHLRKPYYKYSASGQIKMDILETSRGCTHYCSFCSPGSLYPCKYRVHSPEYVFEEVRRLAERDVKFCMLSDDHLGDFERVEKICDLIIESGIRIGFFSFIRPFEGRTDLKRKMVKAGIAMVSYGAESPNPAQRIRYGKGHPKNEDFLKNVNREWLEAGAAYVGNSYLFGDPNDGRDVLSRFGVFARGLNPTYIEPLYSQPYPGTRYREKLEENHVLINDRGWEYFTEGRMLVKHPTVDEEELKKLRAKCWLDFITPRKLLMQANPQVFFYEVLGVPRRNAVAHLRSSAYTVFGCYLEDRFYEDMYPEMVDTYFHETIRTFEPEEMSLADRRLDVLTDMLGLKPLKSLLSDGDIVLRISEKEKTLAEFSFDIRGSRIERGGASIGSAVHDFPAFVIDIPLTLLKRAVTGNRKITRLGALLGMAGRNFVPVLRQILPLLARKQRHGGLLHSRSEAPGDPGDTLKSSGSPKSPSS